MQPSGRLVISAVLCVIAVVPALWEVWVLLSGPGQADPELAVPSRAIGLIVGMFCLAFAGWGIANAIGLLRRLAWVRTSLLLFAGLVIFTNAVGIAGYFLTARGSGHVTLLLPRILLMAAGVWWISLFIGESGRRELSAKEQSL